MSGLRQPALVVQSPPWEENDDEAADIVRGLAQLLRSAAPFKQLQKEDES